jgi:hypothetical protein
MKRTSNILPITSLCISFTPIIIWMFQPSNDIIGGIFFISLWGTTFSYFGGGLGIVSFYASIKQKNMLGAIISAIAILAALGWIIYLIIYYQQGGELFI